MKSPSPKLIQFGEHVEGYEIPVLNEREVWAVASMLLLSIKGNAIAPTHGRYSQCFS